MFLFSCKGASALNCINCKDNPDKLCKHCGCSICGGKENENEQILCDECNEGFHMTCLTPPLTEIPEVDDWLVINDSCI